MQPIFKHTSRRKTMDPQVGQLISNKYRLVRLIGDGGMGSVYEARHELLGTTVALKFLHGALARRKGLVERFLQEAQVSARIKSPHVVTVSDVDRTPDGLAYMVMEYVDGETLQTLYEQLYQRGERLSYGDAFRYMLQMCEGVRAAHKLGIVHRDLKPDNVMLTSDGDGGTKVMILDFGIAKLKASGEVDRGLTRPGVVMGTPEYMAPEQAFSADKVDKRADIFSLGVMFFEMLAGRRPVGGDNAHAIAAQYLEGTIAKLRDLAPTIDPALAAAVHKAMAAKPSQRFDTILEFRNAILPYAPDGSSMGLATATPPPVQVSTVPKTVPPEEAAAAVSSEPSGAKVVSSAPALGSLSDSGSLSAQAFTPEPVSPADGAVEGAAFEVDEDITGAARAEAEAVRGETAQAAGSPTGTSAMPLAEGDVVGSHEEPRQDPLRAGTEPMPEGALQGVLRQPTEDMPALEDLRPRGGVTQVGDVGFSPAAFESGGFVPPAGAAPGAAAPVHRGPTHKKRGPSFVSILLIAAGLSGMVVGGLYLAHEASLLEDNRDDPPKISLPDEDANKKKKKSTDNTTSTQPDPVPDPIPAPDPTTAEPKPQPPPPVGPQPPRPQPSTQPPQPPQPPPLVIPSQLPPLPSVLPFPGLPGGVPPLRPLPSTQPPEQPKPAPQPAPQPTLRPAPKPAPTRVPPLKPVPTVQPAPKPAPAPAPAPAPKRRKFPKLQPKQ